MFKELMVKVVEDVLVDVVADRVVNEGWIHNIETGLIVRRDLATDEDKKEAVAAYARMLRIHGFPES
ncbi:MAG: hypothetical protein QM714_00385 [Nocardioides sp.]|uniref:hypothetical protein n=1 Tax=Nocardioides sp. TaxID=35761 RepID=UPI0039E38EBD